MSSSAFAGLRSVVGAARELQQGDWSLETIADEIGAEIRYRPSPPRVLALTVADRQGSVITISRHLYGLPIMPFFRARCLAVAVAARVLGQTEPIADVIARDFWRRDHARRLWWAAGACLAVSADDVVRYLSGDATADEIAALRDVPAWTVDGRVRIEIQLGLRDGDYARSLVESYRWSAVLLDWLESQTGAMREALR